MHDGDCSANGRPQSSEPIGVPTQPKEGERLTRPCLDRPQLKLEKQALPSTCGSLKFWLPGAACVGMRRRAASLQVVGPSSFSKKEGGGCSMPFLRLYVQVHLVYIHTSCRVASYFSRGSPFSMLEWGRKRSGPYLVPENGGYVAGSAGTGKGSCQ